jgi:hypothetical protein
MIRHSIADQQRQEESKPDAKALQYSLYFSSLYH